MDTTATILRAHWPNPSREGFEAAYQRVAPQVFLWAALHVSPNLRQWLPLEDFLQEVWARAYTIFPKFDPHAGHFRGWLRGICSNVLSEQLRQLRTRRPLATSNEDRLEPSDPRTSVVSGVSRNESRVIVLAAIDALDEDDRRLVAWRGLEGLPYQVVGDRLGIRAVAAESRWRRLLQRLQGQIPGELLAP